MKKISLLTPGPTPVPERVLARLGSPLLHHRTPEFETLFEEVRIGLKKLYQTKNEVLVLACTGTGAMDAAVSNLFSKGDLVITINAGKFGERWAQISKHYGLQFAEWKMERGQALELDRFENFVKNQSGAKAILFQASETSTGLKLPTKAICSIAQKYNLLSVCDAITACGVFDLPMDSWGIDVLITGGQKALMIPPGLACIALSDKAWAASETSNLPKYYFDLRREKKAHLKNQSAWTPATGLIMGLHESLKMIFENGLESLYAQNSALAQATRAGIQAMGLRFLAESAPSEAVTAAVLPRELVEDFAEQKLGKKIIRTMAEEYGVFVIGGQDELEGKIIRFSHFGYVSIFDITTALAAFEMALAKNLKRLQDAGFSPKSFQQPKIGSGPAAALQVFSELQH